MHAFHWRKNVENCAPQLCRADGLILCHGIDKVEDALLRVCMNRWEKSCGAMFWVDTRSHSLIIHMSLDFRYGTANPVASEPPATTAGFSVSGG